MLNLNSNTLDTLISLVIVVLVLSLIVQSIQSLIKKLLKSKSKQIEESLVDLFEHVLGGSAVPLTPPMARVRAWFLGKAAVAPPSAPPAAGAPAPPVGTNPQVNVLFENVSAELYRLGRSAFTGGRILDSISKDDLLKVLGNVVPGTLASGFNADFTAACHAAGTLTTRLNDPVLQGLPAQAAAKFALAREALAPLLFDMTFLLPPGGNLSPNLVLDDVRRLRQADVAAALRRLVEVAADPAVPAAAGPALQAVIAALTDLRAKSDTALAPVRAKLAGVESWFDTVMQGFQERYARGMRTCSLWVSVVVVLALNANLFAIYRQLASSPAARAVVLQSAPDFQRLARSTTQPSLPSEDQWGKDLKAAQNEVNQATGLYAGYGFQPFRYDGLDATTAPGWACMVLLLSLGAPFWEDALESLFGVKTLLRKKSDIRTVEEEPGKGYPKT